jgi:hypothetical protein
MPKGPKPRPLLERVADHIYVDENGCHVWQGSIDGRGRPVVQSGSMRDGTRRPRRVHKLLWDELRGSPPEGFDVHHTCENKLCVNADHLVLLTHGGHSAHHWERLGDRAARDRSRLMLHTQHHVRRGRTSPECPLCNEAAA